MKLPTLYVMTHDSLGLGEDGPTHQPVEHLASLRCMPHLHVFRPADATEVVGAWREAIGRLDGPSMLVLSRQGLPVLEGTDADAVAQGAYVVVDGGDEDGYPDVVLLATGSEVSLCVEASKLLAERGVGARVVSMPCWELFEETDDDYVDEVLPSEVPVLAVEAASGFGWSRWADDTLTVDEFGASGTGTSVLEDFGFTPEVVADAAQDLLDDGDER